MASPPRRRMIFASEPASPRALRSASALVRASSSPTLPTPAAAQPRGACAGNVRCATAPSMSGAPQTCRVPQKLEGLAKTGLRAAPRPRQAALARQQAEATAAALARPKGGDDRALVTLPVLSPQVPTADGGTPEDCARAEEPPRTDARPVGGLAGRRRKFGLQIAVTEEGAASMEKGELLADVPRRTITVAEQISDFYALGEVVMPSSNRGMEVRFARRVSDGKPVVIKVREKAVSFCNKAEEQVWRQTSEMFLNMSHIDSLAEIYEVKEDAQNYYIVMEKCEGMDLFEFLRGESVDVGFAKAVLRQLLEGVQTLHAKGCIHKDLKLENVMVAESPKFAESEKIKRGHSRQTVDEPEPIVKLIDFDTVQGFSPATPVRAESVLGTDQYIAQEAYAGKYSPASDIFSVGVIAYRLICGRFPFKSKMFDDKPGENWVGSPKMKKIQKRLNKFNIDWSLPPWSTETEARDLVSLMLRNNDTERPTATQCLQHAFFNRTGTTPGMPPLTHTWSVESDAAGA